ncbi:MAG: hypothetical protein LUD25_00520 [Coriobacteriaceae bacterium]|nr:hypothetical protein [Coriobacteriaceae bacterium]
MRRTRRILASVCCALLLCCVAVPCAQAAEEETDLVSRYELLDDLIPSEGSEESVVISTDTQMLTGVNRALDGATVTFTAEAIGDVIRAENGNVWVNVLGNEGASLGVFMSAEDAAAITNLGDYDTEGSTVNIVGTYSVACQQHEGELDVHATSVEVLADGGTIMHAFSSQWVVVAVLLCVLGLILLLVYFVFRHRVRADAGDDLEG